MFLVQIYIHHTRRLKQVQPFKCHINDFRSVFENCCSVVRRCTRWQQSASDVQREQPMQINSFCASPNREKGPTAFFSARPIKNQAAWVEHEEKRVYVILTSAASVPNSAAYRNVSLTSQFLAKICLSRHFWRLTRKICLIMDPQLSHPLVHWRLYNHLM